MAGALETPPMEAPPNLCTVAGAFLKGDLQSLWAQTAHDGFSKRGWHSDKITSSTRDGSCSDGCCRPAGAGRRTPEKLALPRPQPIPGTHARPATHATHERPFLSLSPPPQSTLEDLGVSVETFRALRLLQTREIRPEDYDLLMRLHAKPNLRVLDERQLAAVTEKFVADDESEFLSGDACAVCLCKMAKGARHTRRARGTHPTRLACPRALTLHLLRC